jgi:hypothetical protein
LEKSLPLQQIFYGAKDSMSLAKAKTTTIATMSKFVGGHERGKFMELEMFPTIEEEFPIGTIVCLIDPTGMIAEL